jgi:Uma2 family endonuclease
MPGVAKRWTREEVLALPDDGKRYELLDGELLVSPSPTGIHQRAVLKLYDRIQPYVRSHKLGAVALAPADLDFRSGQLLQPDLFVSAYWQGREPLHWAEFGIPFLIVEVLSPSTALNDRNRKRRRYQESGAGEYWIVDTDARLIERWKPEDVRPEILTERIEWQPEPSVSALAIDLTEYFREVWGE